MSNFNSGKRAQLSLPLARIDHARRVLTKLANVYGGAHVK